MIEAGGDQVPEETLLEAFALAHSEIIRICDAIDELAREVGKEKWIDVELNAELDARHGEASRGGSPRSGSATRPGSSTSCSPPTRRRSRWTRARATSSARRRCATGSACCSSRSGWRRSRAPSGRSSRASCARSRTPSRTRRSSSRASATSSSPASRRSSSCPSRSAPRATSIPQTPSRAATSRRPPTRSTRTSSARRSPSTSAVRRRARHGGDPADHDRGRHHAPNARLRAVHARPDADPHALHARHRQGAAADRRPLDRAGAPLHPPLQLPALLGRGDGLHARPEAA